MFLEDKIGLYTRSCMMLFFRRRFEKNMLKGNATWNGCILFSDVLGENEHVVGIWNIFQNLDQLLWTEVCPCRSQGNGSQCRWLCGCAAHCPAQAIQQTHNWKTCIWSALQLHWKEWCVARCFLEQKIWGLMNLPCWMFFFVSGFLTQEPGAEMSSEISTSKCHACFRGLTEQAWLQQVQREDGPARQQRSKPSPAFWELVELWTESLSCIGALASDTLSRIALQAWLSPDLTLLIWWMMNATVLFIFLVHLHPFAFHGHSDRNSWEHWTRQSSWVFDALSSGNSRVKRTVVVAAFLVPVFSTSVKSKSF